MPSASDRIRYRITALVRTNITRLLLLCLLGLSTACPASLDSETFPVARTGVLDLSQWKFNSNQAIPLQGEWYFVWQEFIKPDQFELLSRNPDPSKLLQMPARWNSHIYQENEIGAVGYATLGLQLKLSANAPPLRLRLPEGGSAYRLFINGVLLKEVGQPATRSSDSRGAWRTQYVDLPPGEDLELLIHISNYEYRSGGFWRAIKLGPTYGMQTDFLISIGIEMFLLGAFIMMGMHQLAIFSGRPLNKASLFFGLLCCLCAFQILFSGEYLVYFIISNMPYRLMHSLLFLTVFGGIPLFALFQYHAFPTQFQQRPLHIILGGSLFFILLSIVLPTLWLTRLHIFYKVFAILSEVYMLIVVIKAILARAPGARTFLAGIAILIPATVYDILLPASTGLGDDYLVAMAFFIFLLTQSITLSQRFSTALALAEKKEQAELKSIKNELAYNKARMELQKSNFERLKKIIQPHYLLNTLTALLHWVNKNPNRAEEIVRDLAVEFQQVHIFSQQEWVSLKDEIDLCRSHIRIMSTRHDQEIALHTSKITPDLKIPPLILHTLVENAFYHQQVESIQIELQSSENASGTTTLIIHTTGDFKPDQKGLGIGTDYIEARLRTAYDDGWQMDQRSVDRAWITRISILSNSGGTH